MRGFFICHQSGIFNCLNKGGSGGGGGGGGSGTLTCLNTSLDNGGRIGFTNRW